MPSSNSVAQEFDTLALHRAAKENDLETAKILLESGKYHHQLSWRRMIPESGNTLRAPLHIAAERNHAEMVELLIRYGALPDQIDDKDSTALHIAVAEDAIATIKTLHESGADLNIYDSNVDTPLMDGVKKNKVRAVKTLVELGANINLITLSGQSAISEAALFNHDLLEYLISKNANINPSRGRPDSQIESPIIQPFIIALDAKKYTASHMLLMNGADISVANASGAHPLEIALDILSREKDPIQQEQWETLTKQIHLMQSRGITKLNPNRTSPAHEIINTTADPLNSSSKELGA